MEIKLCQSCAMPMNAPEARYGTEKDGSLNPDYCSYCYDNGEFLGSPTMEQMIQTCLPFEKEARPDKTEEELLKEMRELFPALKRWKERNTEK